MKRDSKPENAPGTTDGSRVAERVAWVGFMLFFVVILAIYIARGIGLERDVNAANQALLEAQIQLSRYTRGEVPRPPSIGLTNAQIQDLQRRGIARPETRLHASLEQSTHLIPHEPVLGGRWYFAPDDVHILNDRWVLAHFEDGHVRGSLLLEYDVTNGNVAWQVIDSYLQD